MVATTVTIIFLSAIHCYARHSTATRHSMLQKSYRPSFMIRSQI